MDIDFKFESSSTDDRDCPSLGAAKDRAAVATAAEKHESDDDAEAN